MHTNVILHAFKFKQHNPFPLALHIAAAKRYCIQTIIEKIQRISKFSKIMTKYLRHNDFSVGIF